MNRALEILNASLVTTAVSGFLYVLGYTYLVHYYGHFGLNIQIREPDIALTLSQGFDYAGFLLLCVVVAVAVYWLETYLLRLVFGPASGGPAVWRVVLSASAGVFAFVYAFLLLQDYVQANATRIAEKTAAARKSSPKVTVTLRDGSVVPGEMRLFFLSKTNVVLLDFSQTQEHLAPGLVVIPIAEVKVLRTD